MKNGYKEWEILSSFFYKHLAEIPFHTLLKKDRRQLAVNEEAVELIEQEILSYSPRFKRKIAFRNISRWAKITG
jgi:hypothetical protein